MIIFIFIIEYRERQLNKNEHNQNKIARTYQILIQANLNFYS